MTKRRSNEKPDALRNHDLVVLALYALKGEHSPVDLEHIAHKVSELAPGRFNWRHYPDQIDIERVRVRLSDNKKPEHGCRVAGGGRKGWRLTAAGFLWAKSASLTFLPAMQARPPIDRSEDRRRKIETARIHLLPAWEKYQSDQAVTITMSEAEAVFRLDEYVEGERRRHIVDRTLSLFAVDSGVSKFVQRMAKLALTQSGGNNGN